MAPQTQEKRTWLGILFLAIGAFLILNRLDIIPFFLPHYLFSWKVILIAVGVFLLVDKKKKDAGIALIVIGGIFLSRDLGFFNPFHVFHYFGFWSLLFIGLGASLLLRKNNSRSESK